MTSASSIVVASETASDRNGISLLLIKFSEAVDERQPSAIAALFSTHGTFRPGDKSVQGRDAIQEFYETRLSDARRRTRHVWSNLLIQSVSPRRVQFRAVLTNYAFEPAVSEQALQMRLGNVTGSCEQDVDGTWRFAEHGYERIFAASLPLTANVVPTPRA